MKKLTVVLLALVLMLSVAGTAAAAGTPDFSYQLLLTDEDGLPVNDPHSLSNGDILRVEIVLTRNDVSGVYNMYGIEFRLLTQGLQFNNDGTTLRAGTEVRERIYSDGSYVGFAWYDLMQQGEPTGNPVSAASWSYTVTDAAAINIKVPVALLYVTEHTESIVPVGTGKVYLSFAGSELDGEDISGEYVSGTKVILPEAEQDGKIFVGWTDGGTVYEAGSEYTVTGNVTLVPVWEEPDRNRYLDFESSGGETVGEDPEGYYADGEIVILPDAEREGYVLAGWSDGSTVYSPGEEYTVYNTVIFHAVWEPVVVTPPPTAEPTPPPTVSDEPVDPPVPPEEPKSFGVVILIGIVGLLVILVIILLIWKRRFVRYSLVSGDIALNVKDNEHNIQVEVILLDNDGREHHLGKSSTVPAKVNLYFIGNNGTMPIAAVKEGTYKGKLVMTDGAYMAEKNCRIKVLDRELRDATR